MPNRKDLHVIPGGKSSGEETDAGDSAIAIDKLRARADHYRSRLSNHPDDEISTLVSDMADAIEALNRLEESATPEAQGRAVEYRRLIADLEKAGIAVKRDRETYPNGRFARIHDPEGNPIELWEPA